ncbi:hypothetical protein D3C86_1633110 [compost metagenome]
MFNWPADGKLSVPNVKNKVVSATLLATKGKVKAETIGDNLTLNLPANAPDAIASVIKVEFEGEVAHQQEATPKKEMKTGALD